MILLTVGTQLPFDRLVEIVDRLAPTLPEPIFAQVGHCQYRPINMEWQPFVGPIEFEQRIEDCSYLISHAGIGTFVMAQKHCKPMILFPRLAVLNEHRNDHQLATVRVLEGRPGVYIAHDEDDLVRLTAERHPAPNPVDPLPDRDRLRGAIAKLIDTERRRLLRF
ncbi:Glycosyltransferase family 28 C-terminal domain-containing protein [Novosphingobium sp. CF614]|uniref:glycosyltransferase n=1 Tax=Novosphingobium sp. CF614 TaxID=1884364 RepID=UPI0008E8C2E6|nr:glycosyltransferase [Novosphingobium sp. CF614]SFG20270.1 Glycosyltransferase family 28 C-terminal domain-containing protein [Novosphingobium sp. CF614]